MKKFVLDRSKWLNGKSKGSEYSRLWNENLGRGCCLGLLSIHLGATVEECSSRLYPGGLTTDNPKVNKLRAACIKPTSSLGVQQDIGVVNDAIGYTEEEREQRLKELFAEHLGYELEFTGELM